MFCIPDKAERLLKVTNGYRRPLINPNYNISDHLNQSLIVNISKSVLFSNYYNYLQYHCHVLCLIGLNGVHLMLLDLGTGSDIC